MRLKKDGNKPMLKKNCFKLSVLILAVLLCIVPYAKDFLFGFQKSEDIGNNTIISEKVSPDGKNKAVSFCRNMGATTWFSFQLSILKPNRKLKNKGGNAFVSESEFDFEWVGDNDLVVTVKENERIFHQHSRVGNVNITYVYEYKNIQH